MRVSHPSQRHAPLHCSSGFTLLEIVVVMVAIGVVATAALIRLPDTITLDTRSEADTLRAHIQYAQQRALTRHAVWGIEFSDAKTYWLYYLDTSGPSNVPVILPGAASKNAANNPDNDQNTINNKQLEIDTTTLPTSTLPAIARIEFDANGSPGRTNQVIRTRDGDTLFTIIAYTGVIH